ncbi:GNAT family N-acetyltransferase [Parabacteroides sp. FAFU027]|uniref:GNAT family N-acetyltransferase n=1 Tax=Parabacteroides sp. FAFU027 TaxID=2922715 RepID=UPI001FAF2B09|nr:GNAT family protein [Parabacteroides sp. FAFU027]
MKTNAVSLRLFHLEDTQRLSELANNEKIASNLRDGFPHPYSMADAKKFISYCQFQQPTMNFAIEYQGEYVGNIGLVQGTDIYCKSAEVGYFIGESYWKKGIASQALSLITRYGFETLGLIRIYTGVFEYNQASMKVLEKCGFTREAIFRKSIWKNDQIWDEYRYALINPECE